MGSLYNKIKIDYQERNFMILVIVITAFILFLTPLFFHIGFILPFVYLGGHNMGNYIYDKFLNKEINEVN